MRTDIFLAQKESSEDDVGRGLMSNTRPQTACDDFYPAWDKFMSAEPRRAKRVSRSARMVQETKRKVDNSSIKSFASHENVATAWQRATNECCAKVAAIVAECRRLNKKYRDAIFDLEVGVDCMAGLDGYPPHDVQTVGPPPWVKRIEDIFEKPTFLDEDSKSQADIEQGHVGDCWFLASLISVSAKRDLFKQLCVARDEQVGVYGFVFFRDGEWIYEVIDDKLYIRVGNDDKLSVVRDWNTDDCRQIPFDNDDEKLKMQLQRGSDALYFARCKSQETWLPLIEKAYAKAHGDYYSIESGFAGEGIEDLTGGVSTVVRAEDIMDRDRFWSEQLMKVNQNYLFAGSCHTSTKNLVSAHAYAVLEAWEGPDGLKLLKLRNPWGKGEWSGDWGDGSKLWTPQLMIDLKHTFGDDGVFWISYADFLKHFNAFHRARLFDDQWFMSQRWTSVNVPWTVDYLDTKFQVNIKEKGPAVFVLSQPDRRYFKGLQGRYLFSLHFRIQGQDNDKYLARSLSTSGSSGGGRSVSAEVDDLEPGNYSVILKITAVRSQESTAHQTIVKYAIDKKQKLLQVGRRFDYANTKGNLKAKEEENRKDKRQTDSNRENERLRKARTVAKKEREQHKKRQARIEKHRNRNKTSTSGEETTAETGLPPTCPATIDANVDTEAAQNQECVTEQATASTTEPVVTHKAAQISSITDTESTQSSSVPKDNISSIVIERTRGSEEETRSEDSNASTISSDGQRTPSTVEGSETNAPWPDEKAERVATVVCHHHCCCSCSGESCKNAKPAAPPAPPPEDIRDEDFDWDAELDGLVSSDEDDDEDDSPPEWLRDDPWNATCVLGLRVYTRGVPTDISVVEHDDDEDNDDDEDSDAHADA